MSILDEIVASKRQEVEKLKQMVPQQQLNEQLEKRGRRERSFLDFDSKKVQIIAEIKRASPSRGDIAPNLDVVAKVAQYQRGGADALSVLTDRYFKGVTADLTAARGATSLPVLRKDFIFDEYQLVESTLLGADAVLLIARILTADELEQLYTKAVELGLVPLVEVYDEEDAVKAGFLHGAFIGINNRNLSTFDVSLTNVLRLRDALPQDNHLISLSGITSAEALKSLTDHGIRSFLIGEYLAKAEDAAALLQELKSC